MIVNDYPLHKAKLACDVFSGAHGRQEIPDKKARGGIRVETGPKCYGRKNDEVKIISEHGNITIVENGTGNRYPVKAEFLIQ